jgi:hypothetical protein
MLVRKAYDHTPKFLADELLRLAKIDRDWLDIESINEKDYKIRVKYRTILRDLGTDGFRMSGADGFSMLATSIWLLDGPKTLVLTDEQCDALEQVEVRVGLEDYQQPYSAILVQFPEGRYRLFSCTLCHIMDKTPMGKVLSLVSSALPDRRTDITTTVSERGLAGEVIEVSLTRFHDDVSPDEAAMCARATRVAVNACLCLANFEHRLEWLLPKEVARDQQLGREQSERGAKARARLKTQVEAIKLDSTVRLHRVADEHGVGEPTGREVRCHWRRGHWHTVLYGVGKSQRRLAFFSPVLVRADRAAGETSEMTTTYK